MSSSLVSSVRVRVRVHVSSALRQSSSPGAGSSEVLPASRVGASSSWALLPSEEGEPSAGAGTISPRSRDCVGGTERLPSSSTPSERAGLRHEQARGTSPVTTPEGLDERSQSGRRALREVTTSFSFSLGLCVNDCGWRLSS